MTTALRTLLAEAAEWRLLELLFSCPSPRWRHLVADLGGEVEDPELRQAAEKAVEQATEGTFHSILGPGGPAPAREASYQHTVQLGYLMSELAAYYDAFAYQRDPGEPVDHVSVEAGFLGYLRLKQAFAHACGEDGAASVAREAADTFLREHLVFIAEPLSTALNQSGEPYLELAGQALLRRTGPRPRQIFEILDEAAAEQDESIFECGVS